MEPGYYCYSASKCDHELCTAEECPIAAYAYAEDREEYAEAHDAEVRRLAGR